VEYLGRVRELFLGFCDSDVVAVDASVPEDRLAEKIFAEVLRVVALA